MIRLTTPGRGARDNIIAAECKLAAVYYFQWSNDTWCVSGSLRSSVYMTRRVDTSYIFNYGVQDTLADASQRRAVP